MSTENAAIVWDFPNLKIRRVDPSLSIEDSIDRPWYYAHGSATDVYAQELSSALAAILGQCGCGMPEEAERYLYTGLEWLERRTAALSKAYQESPKHHFMSKGEYYFFFYWLDHVELTDHGSSVPGWLNERGKEALHILRLMKVQPLELEQAPKETEAARWRIKGEEDPHEDLINKERAELPMGDLTDDEMANAVFIHGNERPTPQELIAGTAKPGIVYLQAAKERIRWLSRKLEEQHTLKRGKK